MKGFRMSYEPWYYFLSLEKDFVGTIDFVHLHAANAKTFSNEYAKLILLIGSEVDVVAKMLCQSVAPGQKAENIDLYRTIITDAFPGMHTIEIDITKFAMKVQPWLNWDPAVAQSPNWWKSYNNVKHQRDKSFSDANQESTLNAICGLLALLLYYFRKEGHLQPSPEILNYDFPRHLVVGGKKKLPGT